jgi:hypothetical protein
LGKIGHLERSQFWLQEVVALVSLEVERVGGTVNRAGALTKYLDRDSIEKHNMCTHQSISNGRHELMSKAGEHEMEVDGAQENEAGRWLTTAGIQKVGEEAMPTSLEPLGKMRKTSIDVRMEMVVDS